MVSYHLTCYSRVLTEETVLYNFFSGHRHCITWRGKKSPVAAEAITKLTRSRLEAVHSIIQDGNRNRKCSAGDGWEVDRRHDQASGAGVHSDRKHWHVMLTVNVLKTCLKCDHVKNYTASQKMKILYFFNKLFWAPLTPLQLFRGCVWASSNEHYFTSPSRPTIHGYYEALPAFYDTISPD